MAKGKAKSTLLGIQGVVGHKEAPDWDFLYAHSTIKDPKWNIGDRVVTPDGRVFRYAKASGTMNPDILAQHVTGQHIGYVALGASQVIDDKEVTLTVAAATHGVGGAGVIAKDELRGGYILIFDASSKALHRGITGNSALAANGTSITIYLDGALTVALISGTDHAEVIASPYLAVSNTLQSKVRGFLGLPMSVALTGEYFWLQTWGPCWVAPDNGNSSVDVGNTLYNLQVVSRYTGHVAVHDSADAENALNQHVGFVLSRGAGVAQGAPFIMLQISP